MGSAATPAEKYFQGKYLKHEQQRSGVEMAGKAKSEIRRFCAYVGFKEWGTPAELLGRASQASEDISRWVHYRGISISTLGASPSCPPGGSMGRNTVFPTRAESTGGSGDKKSKFFLPVGQKKPDHTTQVHVRSCCWS